MKKIFISAIALFVIMTFAKAEDVKYFPQKNGILQYNLSGFIVGKQTIYYEDYGQKYIIEQDMEYFGTPNKSKTYIVKDSSFSIDQMKNQGYKFQDIEKTNYIKFYKQTNDPNKAYQELYKSEGGKVIGTEKIKKAECEVWEMPMGLKKIWLCDGMIYKIQLIESGKTGTFELVQADHNITFDKDYFKLPDIKFEIFGLTKGKGK